MTRRECEARILEQLKVIGDLCEAYLPGMSVCLNVSDHGQRYGAFALEKREDDKIVHVLDCYRFPDGTDKIDGKYYAPDGSVY